MYKECIPCILTSYLRLVETGVVPGSLQEVIFRRLLEFLSRVDYNLSPPALAREMHRLIRESVHDRDPYHRVKDKYNRLMLELYPEFERMINGSGDPFDKAMRLAIAGNVIDFGTSFQLDVMTAINKVMEADLAIDDSLVLRRDLERAASLLYIGDNCGEIVLDKLFLACMDVPEKYFAVRNSPVINDVTPEDADITGMGKVARVITTGDDAPGAVWESASDEFKDVFKTVDVVISKGQGNLEGLLNVTHDHIYFLMVIKCDFIAERVGAGKGGFIVKKGNENHHSLR